jgi:hypothetical protein
MVQNELEHCIRNMYLEKVRFKYSEPIRKIKTIPLQKLSKVFGAIRVIKHRCIERYYTFNFVLYFVHVFSVCIFWLELLQSGCANPFFCQV